MLGLRDAADKERETNANLLAQHNGTPVVFGQLLQLQHVKTGKVRGPLATMRSGRRTRCAACAQYLAMVPKAAAELETANTLVALNVEPGTSSLFHVCAPRDCASWEPHCSPGAQIAPRFKVRSAGQRVAVGDSVLLVAAKSGLALHVSDAAFDGDECRAELNGSSTSARTGFRVSPYADYRAAGDECVLGGDLVRLWHAESEGALVLDPPRGGAPGAVYVRSVRASGARCSRTRYRTRAVRAGCRVVRP